MIRTSVASALLALSAVATAHAQSPATVPTPPADAPLPPTQPASPQPVALPADLPGRIVALARGEHELWHRAFVDIDGRLASATVSEAETSTLADGVTPAWRRVAAYWVESGTLGPMRGRPGAGDCAYASEDVHVTRACRTFLVDAPWSAAFVSWVMVRAGVAGFRASPSHVDFVAHALKEPAASPYTFHDPAQAAVAPGDILCFVRSTGTPLGHAGVRAQLAGPLTPSLPMHCDIAIDVDAPRGRLALVGGNVQQGVVLRLLHLNRAGRIWAPMRSAGIEAPCSPEQPAGCSFNRQDWAVLLKLKPGWRGPAAPSLPTPPAAR